MTDFAEEKGLPWLGSLLPISRDPLNFFTTLLRRHNGRVRLRVLGRHIVLLSAPKEIEEVLVTNREAYGRSQEVLALRPVFGQGLLSSDGPLWRRQRSLIQPSFQHDALQRYASIMLLTIERQIHPWQPGDILNTHAEMMRYTRDVICSALFGETIPNAQALGEAVNIVFGDLRSEVLYLDLWRKLPMARSRKWNHAVQLLNAAIRNVIEQRRSHATQPDDLLSAMLHAHGPEGSMSDQQVHDELLTFFLAGHETAALSLTWACALLAAAPQAQRRLADEVRQVKQDGELLPEHVSRLPFTSAVIKESLRLYPPVWSMGRKVSTDTQLAGEPMLKGTDIWICLFSLHRNGQWFEDPDRFLPERWIDQPPPKAFTFLPFGIGPRVCIGQHFAMAEAILALASIVSRFHLAPLGEIATPKAWITLRPKSPIRLRLSKRA